MNEWLAKFVAIVALAFGTTHHAERSTALAKAASLAASHGTDLPSAYESIRASRPLDFEYLEGKRIEAGLPKFGDDRQREDAEARSAQNSRARPQRAQEEAEAARSRAKAEVERAKAKTHEGERERSKQSQSKYKGGRTDDHGPANGKRPGRGYDDFHLREKRLHAACSAFKSRDGSKHKAKSCDRYWFDGYYRLPIGDGRGPLPQNLKAAVRAAYALPATMEEALAERRFWINSENELCRRFGKKRKTIVDPLVRARRRAIDDLIMFEMRATCRQNILDRLEVALSMEHFDIRHILVVVSRDIATTR